MSMKRLILLGTLLSGVWVALAACSSPTANTLVQPTIAPFTVVPATSTSAPAAATPMGKVKVYYEDNAQVELIAPDGTRVLIDVYDPHLLSSPATATDILLTTHTHSDHMDQQFVDSFPGRQIFVQVGAIQRPGLAIQGIAAAHNRNATPVSKDGTDYIFVVDLGGLRFAHLGDLGQDALTADQLAALGRVDVAFTQFSNPYSGMDAVNKMGFNLVDQFTPRLIIPTHNDPDAAKLEAKTWPALYTDADFVSIGESELAGGTRILFLGAAGRTYGRFVKATQVDW